MVVGYVLTILGVIGTFALIDIIGSDRYYTYSFPLTDHETMMIFLLVVCFIMAAAGIMIIVFSVQKKNNQDRLTRITNMEENGRKKNVCPNCGLNLADNVLECPRCHTKIEEREEKK
ncbi:MAG: hypothetical protein ACI3VN_04175 [Candidatus Onthomonas sp.]